MVAGSAVAQVQVLDDLRRVIDRHVAEGHAVNEAVFSCKPLDLVGRHNLLNLAIRSV